MIPRPFLIGTSHGMCRFSSGVWHAGKCLLKFTHKEFGGNEDVAANTAPSFQPSPDQMQAHYLSISVHQRMSSFSFMKTGKCWSLPCFMEFDLVVMVLTLLN